MMASYEERIKALQWKWNEAHLTLRRYEILLREYRLTSLALIVIAISGALFLQKQTRISSLMLGFSGAIWAYTYIMTLGPHILSTLSGRFRYEEELMSRYREGPDSPGEREFRSREDSLYELSIELEKVVYVQRKFYRYVRMSTILLICGIVITAISFAFLLMTRC